MSNGNIPLIKAMEAFLKSRNASPKMRVELARFATLCGRESPVFAITPSEVKECVMEVKKAADRKKRIEALVTFFDFAKESGWIRINPAAGLVQKKEPKQKPIAVKAPKSEGIWLSPEGRREMESEVKELLIRKDEVIAEVAAAREEGDLKENAGYHDARERLALIEAQLRQKTDILARAVDHPS